MNKKGNSGKSPGDLVWMEQAATEFGVNARTLYRLRAGGAVEFWKVPGDRKSYVSRAELMAALRPQKRLARQSETSVAGDGKPARKGSSSANPADVS